MFEMPPGRAHTTPAVAVRPVQEENEERDPRSASTHPCHVTRSFLQLKSRIEAIYFRQLDQQ